MATTTIKQITPENIASGIPTSSYSLITSYGTGVVKWDSNADANNLRCIKYGNGLKRLTGIFQVTTALSSGAVICVVPSEFSRDDNKNGNIQGFPLIANTDGTPACTALFEGSNVMLFSASMPAGAYIIDHFYF